MKSHSMTTEEIREIIGWLMEEMQEEEIGMRLFTSHYQNDSQLSFFNASARERIGEILFKLSEDSKKHKILLERIILHLERKPHGR